MIVPVPLPFTCICPSTSKVSLLDCVASNAADTRIMRARCTSVSDHLGLFVRLGRPQDEPKSFPKHVLQHPEFQAYLSEIANYFDN